MELIQNAYQGFAKDNFTMLDNLKLGYGGTAGEMARLINDSGVLGKSIKVTNKTVADVPFDKVIKAINVIQTRMGITGTTAKEAGRTIAGSVGAMKAAWTNLVTGFADGNADIESLIEDLVGTIVGDGTENNLGVIGNVLPAIETALGGIAKLIEGAAPKIIEILPGLVERIVPSIISAATGMVNAVVKVVPDLLNTVVDALINNAPALIDSASALVVELANGILKQLPKIVKLGLDLIVSLANGIADSLPELIPSIVDVVLQIVETLTDPENLVMLLDAAVAIITAIGNYLLQPETISMLLTAAIGVVNNLVTFLQNNLSPLLNAAIQMIMSLVNYLLVPENLAKLVEMATELIATIAGALIGRAGELVKAAGELILQIIKKFGEADWEELGKNLIAGFKKGISNAWANLKAWFTGLFGDLVGIAKKILGIKSPSRVFKKIGLQTAEGYRIGFEDEFSKVKGEMEEAMDFDDVSVGINSSIRKVGAGAAGGAFGGTSIGNININIDGAKYSDEQSLASAIALEIQNMTDRRAAVYA